MRVAAGRHRRTLVGRFERKDLLGIRTGRTSVTRGQARGFEVCLEVSLVRVEMRLLELLLRFMESFEVGMMMMGGVQFHSDWFLLDSGETDRLDELAERPAQLP